QPARHVEAPRWPAVTLTAFGEDLDDTVARLGPVKRGSRSALQDFDSLDVVGIEITEPVRGRAAREGAACERPCADCSRPLCRPAIDANAVDVDHGTLIERKARVAANTNVARATGASADTYRPQTGYLRRERLADVRNWQLILQLRHVDAAKRPA